jgi:hypothetical protein
LESENGSIQKAMLRMCRALNLKYDEHTIDLTISHLEGLKERGKAVPPFFSIYKFKLTSGLKMPMKDRANVDLTYQEVTSITVSGLNTLDNFDKEEIDQDVIMFWGEGFTKQEYEWLERELDDWKSTHRSDTKAERTLLREIVFKQFEIEKARREGNSTDSLFKGLESALKTANLDPNKSNAAGAGKSQDTFSSFISLIESGEPAEVFGDERDAFKDFQNIDYYFKKYVVRSLKNFLTGSKDFSLENNEDDMLLDDADVVLDDDGTSIPEVTDGNTVSEDLS